MPQALFLGQTYPSRSRNIATDRCINFYPEVNLPDSKGQPFPSGPKLTLIGTPGSVFAFSTGEANVRGMHVFNNLLYVVAGTHLYSIDTNGHLSAALGTLPSSVGPVIIVDNGTTAGIDLIGDQTGNQLYISDGSNTGYIFDTNSQVFTTTLGGGTVTYIAGYFIINLPGSRTIQASNSLNGLVFSSFGRNVTTNSSDNVQAVKSLNDQLWVIKEFNTLIYSNNGQTPSLAFPYSYIPGTAIDYGTPAPHSVARGNQALFFVANARQGDGGKYGGIVMLQGNAASMISNPAIDYQVTQFPKISDAIGFCRNHEGHSFYIITFPSANAGLGWTFVYDITTSLWHEWSSYVEPYQVVRHLANCYAFFNGKEYVGDFATGNIYELSSKYYTDAGNPIVSSRICQHQYDPKNLNNIFIQRLQVDMETGVGDSDVLLQTDLDPLASLSWSNDGGHTYGNEYLAAIGRVGNYKVRLLWRRLGYAKDRVFKLTVSDPIKKTITGVYVT